MQGKGPFLCCTAAQHKGEQQFQAFHLFDKRVKSDEDQLEEAAVVTPSVSDASSPS